LLLLAAHVLSLLQRWSMAWQARRRWCCAFRSLAMVMDTCLLTVTCCCCCSSAVLLLYAALEHGVAGKAADVYSFGVLLWQVRKASNYCQNVTILPSSADSA
jgi:hypothetical protein